MYHSTDSGLRNVWLANGFEIKKTPFGDAVTFHDSDGLTQAICQTLAAKIGVLTGVELRYIRSAGMGLSQPALGTLMGIDGQSIARCEKSGKEPRWADKLVRLLYAAQAQAQGNEPICRVVERIVRQRIEVQEDHGHWTPSVEESTDEMAV
jgi:DNA-binding transcriptional regulator YiaG